MDWDALVGSANGAGRFWDKTIKVVERGEDHVVVECRDEPGDEDEDTATRARLSVAGTMDGWTILRVAPEGGDEEETLVGASGINLLRVLAV